MPSRFWLYFLKSLNLPYLNKSTAIPGINREDAYSLRLKTPPLNEQKRIADKLDSPLKRVDTCRERLDRVPLILKRFRQAVLAAATSGVLTEDWGELNTDGNPIGAKQGSSASPGFGADAKKGEADESFASTLQGREEREGLPEGWKWTYSVEVCDAVVDCPHSTPKWTRKGKLCVRTTNIKPGFLDLSQEQYASEENFAERIQRQRPRCGDILYSREGGILGIACIIPVGIELCLGQRMILLRTNPEYRPELLMLWLNSPQTLVRVQELTGGSASPHLNVRDIKNLPTPFPPLPEQHEIVRRVEKLFAFADRMEARYTAARSQVEKLTPSLIAKAFRGEQVEQDPTDEPAAVLLERIRAQKESAHTRKRTASVLPDFPRRDNPPVGAASGREQSVIRGQRPLLQKSSESVAPITPRQHPPRAPQGHETGTGVFPCRTDRRHRLSDADWTWAIRQLRESGQVVQVGERRGARYHRKE